MTFQQRLSALMMRGGVTASELSRRVGVSRQSVGYWLSGRSQPAADTAAKISEVFDVDPLWLCTGQADVLLEPVPNPETVDKEKYASIPEYSLHFGCGEGDPPHWVEVPSRTAHYRLDFFGRLGLDPAKCRRVQVSGDSMEPLIRDGDTVLIADMNESDPIVEGYIYAFSYAGHLKIKRLSLKVSGDLVIYSDNPKYEHEIVPKSSIPSLIKVYGRVIERSGLL